ncbi:MAG: NAD-dependent epimerase/dehydratase family protein [Woeseiaceae bacterium]
MITLVVGPGYTGSRVLAGLEGAIAVGRSLPGERRLDLDGDANFPIPLPAGYSVIYPVPPAPEQTGDDRLRRFLELLPHDPARIVYLSTTGVYGNRDGALVDETTEPNPQSESARRRHAAETLLKDWCSARDTDAVILRVPGIYGPGRLGTGRIRAATPVLRTADASPGNRIHVDDLASCCIAASSADAPAGIYNVGDGDTRSTTWFMNEVARQAGLPPPPTVTREEAEKTFSPMRLSFLRESRIVDTRKMRETLGVTPNYANPADGIAASLSNSGGASSESQN